MEATTAFKFQRSQVSAEHRPAILSGSNAHQRHDAACQVQCVCAFIPILPGLEWIVFGGSPNNRTVLFRAAACTPPPCRNNRQTPPRGFVWETPTPGVCCVALEETELHVNNGRFNDLHNATPAWLVVKNSIAKKDDIAYSSKMGQSLPHSNYACPQCGVKPCTTKQSALPHA